MEKNKIKKFLMDTVPGLLNDYMRKEFDEAFEWFGNMMIVVYTDKKYVD